MVNIDTVVVKQQIDQVLFDRAYGYIKGFY
jgi:hypothetical protein